jgi:hypothetical protein
VLEEIPETYVNFQKDTLDKMLDYSANVKTPGNKASSIDNEIDVNQPAPPGSRQEQAKIVKQVVDDIQGKPSGLPLYKPSMQSTDVELPDPDKFQVEGSASLKQFAKDLGVDLGNSYDAWAYIRDMSAGLLASDDNTFLGALGDAALLSNKNRATMDAAQKELQAKLAMAKWKNEQDWAKVKYKGAVDLAEAGLRSKGTAASYTMGSPVTLDKKLGATISFVPITKGADAAFASNVKVVNHPEYGLGFIKQEGDSLSVKKYIQEQTKETIGRIDESFKAEGFDTTLEKYLMRQDPYNNTPILKVSNDYKDQVINIMKGNEEAAEGYLEALEDGDPQAAEAYASSLGMSGQIIKQLQLVNREGIWTEQSDSDKDSIKQLIESWSRRLAKADIAMNPTAPNYRDADDYNIAAMNLVLPNINWGVEGPGKFRIDLSEKQLKSALSDSDAVFGTDFANDPFVFELLNFVEPIIPGGDTSIMYNKGETEWLNKTQEGLLNDYNRQALRADHASNREHIARKMNDRMTPEEVGQDYLQEVFRTRAVGGGEDVLGPNNESAKYIPLRTWFPEPGNSKTRKERIDKGYIWYGTEGYWFDPKTGKTYNPVETIQPIKLIHEQY